MVADVRLATMDANGITDGEIPIFDMAGFTLRHLTKVVLSSLRCYMKYTQVKILYYMQRANINRILEIPMKLKVKKKNNFCVE